MSLLAKTKRLLISTLTTSQAQRLYSFSLRYTLIRWKQPFTANLEFSVPRGDCSSVFPSLRHASRSSSCWSSPTRNLSRRLSSRPAEEPVVLKSWKVCWSNSCTTAVASVFSSLVPCTRVWGIWSQSCCAWVAPADLLALQPTGSSAGRDESLLDRFLVGLDQQLEDLDACLREGRTLEQSPLGSENSRLAVKSYFQRISVYLKEKEYSRCAWEVVSVEIRRCLVFANKLIGKLRK